MNLYYNKTEKAFPRRKAFFISKIVRSLEKNFVDRICCIPQKDY